MNNTSKIAVKIVKDKNYSKYYFTVDFMDIESDFDLNEIYRILFTKLKENNLKIVYEKFFGKISYQRKWNKMRKRILEENNIETAPSLYIEGLSVKGSPMSGVQVYAVSIDETCINYIRNRQGYCIGTEIINKDRRVLHLLENTESIPDKENEYNNILQDFEDTILQYNFVCTDIIRTWIYLYDINSYYQNFNKARRDFFTKVGINYMPNANNLPASTCIEGYGVNKTSCMQVYCIDKQNSDIEISRVYNEYQNEAAGDSYIYKPTFSRGIIVNYEDLVELQISGTASINKDGNTIYINNPYKQIEYTLKNIENILRKADMDFSDLCHVTCFFKEPQYYNMFESILKSNHITKFPCNCVVGNVCRDDLLFEIDGIAVKQLAGGEYEKI